MPISHGFTQTHRSTGTPSHNVWSEFQHDPALLSRADLSLAVATYIMDNWFGGMPDYFAAWQAKVRGHTHTDAHIQQHLNDMIQSNLRLPTDPPLLIVKGPLAGQENLDHLEGLVAEHLWHMCASEAALCPAPRFLGDLGFRVHDKGPDGFVIVDAQGTLEFRLWEIKKNSTPQSARSTVDGAADQLQRRAPDYLQEIAALNRHHPDATLTPVFQNLVRHWSQQSPAANVGIAVVTSRPAGTAVPFANFGSLYLSGFKGSTPMQGLLMNMNDLRTFALEVRQVIWNGL